MKNILSVVVLYIVLFMADGYSVMKGYKECRPRIYLTIFFIAFSLNILVSLNVKLTSPATLIEKLILSIIEK